MRKATVFHREPPAHQHAGNVPWLDPEEQMAGQIVRGERRGRIVVEDREVCDASGSERPERPAEILGGERLTGLEHREDVDVHAGVARLEEREARFGEHIGADAIRAERGRRGTACDRRVAHVVVHVRSRVVEEPAALLRGRVDFLRAWISSGLR
jgi:hypothetical protein